MPRAPVSFLSQGQSVIGVLHTPDAGGPAPAVLFLHGFAGHKAGPHRMLVQAAEALVRRGIAALRFDYRGCGDSEGESVEMTLTGHLDDARAALAWLRARPEVDPGRVALLGYSLGGAVAALLAEEGAGVRAVALWAPMAHFADLEDEGHVARLQGRIDRGGTLIGRAFYASLDGCDPAAALGRAGVPVLLVHGSRDTWAQEHAAAYQAALPPERLRVAVVDGADHEFTAHRWVEALLAETVPWLAGALGAGPAAGAGEGGNPP